MIKIIEIAHELGLEIAKSDEIKNLEAAKAAFEADAELNAQMSEYETERKLLDALVEENEIFGKLIIALIGADVKSQF